jgi:hypothetical protein
MGEVSVKNFGKEVEQMAREMTRRDFLKATTLVGVLASAGSRSFGQSSDQINVAIIGTGEHGRTLLGLPSENPKP